jgi:hypothetical protein
MSLSKVCTECIHYLQVVAEISERLIAIEAKQTADPAGRVIVIHMGRWSSTARPTLSALRGEHAVIVGLPDAVALSQVVLTATAVEPLACCARASVMARLAATAASTATTLASWEVVERLKGLTIGTPSLPVRNNPTRLNGPPGLSAFRVP